MGRSRPTDEEKLLAAGIATGEKRGRLRTIALILEAQAAAIIAEQYSQVAAAVASGGVVAGSKALAQGLKGMWSGMWRTALYAPILMLFEQAELDTDQGKYQPPFDVRRPGFGEFLESYLDNLSNLLNETTRSNISEVLEEAKREGYSVDRTAQRIREESSDVSQNRARFIARDQLLKASKGGASAKARLSGVVVTKSRHDSNDAKVRDTHREWDGEKVGINELYSSGEMFPGEEEFN